jgi:ABC-type nickel/cobalt efflux system permease component RcnA
MIRATRRIRPAVRTGLMLVFALWLCVQPVLAAMSETHSVSAHGAAAQPHADHADAHDAPHDGDVPHEAPEGVLHLLMHHAQCCTHGFGLAPGALAAFVGPHSALSPQAPLLQLAASHPSDPFRPPIRA